MLSIGKQKQSPGNQGLDHQQQKNSDNKRLPPMSLQAQAPINSYRQHNDGHQSSGHHSLRLLDPTGRTKRKEHKGQEQTEKRREGGNFFDDGKHTLALAAVTGRNRYAYSIQCQKGAELKIGRAHV